MILINKESEKNNFTNREFQLSQLNIKAKVAGDKLLFSVLEQPRGIAKLIGRKFHIVNETYNFFEKEILDLSGDVYINGYWQSEKYFLNIKSLIIDEFQVHAPLAGKNKDMAHRIQNTESVSIHIRRGDYVSNPVFSSVIGICSLDYYKKAIDFFNASLRLPLYYIFSDDIEWARANLKKENTFIYVDHNNETNCSEDLRLMSLCKHNIIANSSFSWWGAFLNQNIKKKVVAPKIWFKDPSLSNKDMIPESWIRL